MRDPLGVGMVGYGFIGKVHTYAYLSMPLFYDPVPCRTKLVGVCTAHMETARKAQEQAGYEVATADYQDLLEREDIYIIDCCTPNVFHRDLVIDALRAGKHVYCDKPLAMDRREAEEIWGVAQEVGAKGQMAFEYRFVPAVMKAKALVEEGFVGEVLHFRARYLHSGYVDPDRPMSWRLDRAMSGGGALFDLGSHAIDLVRHLVGEIEEVWATTATFNPERPAGDGSGRRVRTELDELAILNVRTTDGGVGIIEASRVATGTNDDLKVEIHGRRGAILYDHMNPNWLFAYDNTTKGEKGFQQIETVQRYPKPAVLPAPKLTVGWMRYHVASQFDFLRTIVEDREPSPGIYDGVRVQAVMEAAYRSAEEGRWVGV